MLLRGIGGGYGCCDLSQKCRKKCRDLSQKWYNGGVEDEIHYCVNCGVPLEPGNWYKCDACLEAELGISSPDYEPRIDDRWGGGENRSDEGENDDGRVSDDSEGEDDSWVDEGLKEIAEQKRKEKIEEYRKRRGAA